MARFDFTNSLAWFAFWQRKTYKGAYLTAKTGILRFLLSNCDCAFFATRSALTTSEVSPLRLTTSGIRLKLRIMTVSR
jgi:hypothetical protein